MSRSRPVLPPHDVIGDGGPAPVLERRNVRVLVLDDDPDFRAAVEDHVELAGYRHDVRCRFLEEPAGMAALFTEFCPTVVILDVHSTVVDALESLSRWRGGAARVVAVGRSADEKVRATALAFGADAYVTSSADYDDVGRVIDEVVRISGEAGTPH